MRESGHQQLHALGLMVHTALVVLHLLGVAYNARRGNRWQAALHGAVAGYDGWGASQHARDLR